MISLDVDIHFKTCPAGADTDLLDDTVCYLTLVQLITDYCGSKSFNLIEHLAKSVYQVITSFLIPRKHILASITVELHKISPPVPNVHGGVKWKHHVSCEGTL